jgi:hypothetical protein
VADAEVYFRGGHDERGSTHLAIKGSGGFGPQWGPGACPWSGGSEGLRPLKVTAFQHDYITLVI